MFISASCSIGLGPGQFLFHDFFEVTLVKTPGDLKDVLSMDREGSEN